MVTSSTEVPASSSWLTAGWGTQPSLSGVTMADPLLAAWHTLRPTLTLWRAGARRQGRRTLKSNLFHPTRPGRRHPSWKFRRSRSLQWAVERAQRTRHPLDVGTVLKLARSPDLEGEKCPIGDAANIPGGDVTARRLAAVSSEGSGLSKPNGPGGVPSSGGL